VNYTEQVINSLKRLALFIPAGLLAGFAIGLIQAGYDLGQSGDWSYGLWRTVIEDVTRALNGSFFIALNLIVLLFLTAGVQILFGREFGGSLRAAVGLLLFFPLFLATLWLFTKFYISVRGLSVHRLPDLLRDNSDFALYMKKYFFSVLDLYALSFTFFARIWWMLAGLLVGCVFAVWFDRGLFRIGDWLSGFGRRRKKGRVQIAASVGQKPSNPWIKRLLVSLSMALVLMVIINMADKGAAIANREPRPNVILISIDTLRADRLGCYGNPSAQTPYMDLLSKNGVLFEEAISNSSWTLPGHGAMLTSVQPTALGLFKVTDRLNSHALTLAEVLRDHGFDTGAIVSYILLDRSYGFDQGFDFFDYEDLQDAQQIVDKAIKYIEPRSQKKFFLFMHLYDPHWPYEPPEEVAKAFWPGAVTPQLRNLITTGDYAQFALKVIKGPELLNDFCRAMYDGEIAYTDRELGRLFKFLVDRRMIDRTIVILTSDHGEEFKDHGYFGHGLTLYDEVLRVPLIMRFPMLLPSNMRVKGQVQSLDIFPTVLGLVGLDPARYPLGGRDLLGMIHAGSADPVPVISETSMSGDRRYALRDGRYKLITPYKLDFGGNLQIDQPEEVFDLQTDSQEKTNLDTSHPKMVEVLRQQMAKQMDAIKKQWGMGERMTHSQELSAEEIERLRSLGYLN